MIRDLFSHLFRPRIHESVALAGLTAVSAALHMGWLIHFILFRSSAVLGWFLLDESVGPISGIYLMTLLMFVLVFVLSVLWFRGRDCTDFRDRVFWFFIVSLILFAILTFPPVYGFEIIAEAV
jgi:hypothetical protein